MILCLNHALAQQAMMMGNQVAVIGVIHQIIHFSGIVFQVKKLPGPSDKKTTIVSSNNPSALRKAIIFPTLASRFSTMAL